MKWKSEDIEMYVKAREYVDTIILPLYPISFEEKMGQTAAMTEMISLLSIQIEKHFKGRILLMPGYSYLKASSGEELSRDLQKWEKEFFEKGFTYVIYLTCDRDWQGYESQLQGSLIWLPTLPLQKMDEKSRYMIMEDQVKQVNELLIEKW